MTSLPKNLGLLNQLETLKVIFREQDDWFRDSINECEIEGVEPLMIIVGDGIHESPFRRRLSNFEV